MRCLETAPNSGGVHKKISFFFYTVQIFGETCTTYPVKINSNLWGKIARLLSNPIVDRLIRLSLSACEGPPLYASLSWIATQSYKSRRFQSLARWRRRWRWRWRRKEKEILRWGRRRWMMEVTNLNNSAYTF